jgi:DNA-binding NtrC family response regulator
MLLRFLENGEVVPVGSDGAATRVDVRVISATNRNLHDMVAKGLFREDLLYRINVGQIEVPPLRERREDIPMLAWTFVKEFAATFGKPIEHIDEASMAALVAHAWPGNVRELRNVVERAMILSRGPTLHIELSPLRVGKAMPKPAAPPATLEKAEREHLLQTLQRCGWRIRGAGGAAAQLGLKPTTLESRLKKLGLHRPHATSDASE